VGVTDENGFFDAGGHGTSSCEGEATDKNKTLSLSSGFLIRVQYMP
jgi:hypothetical protein